MPAPAPKFTSHTWHRPTGAVEDPFTWLRDREDPDTLAYLQAENAYADEWFAAHADTVETLFDEIRSRVQETDLTPPVHHRGWWYVSRTEQGKAYPSHCRGRTPETATETMLLDQNVEAEGHEYFDLALFELSVDHRFAAWSSDTTGDEHFTLRIRDLEHGTDLSEEINDTSSAGAAWSADGRYVFYVTPDAQDRPCRVWRHEVGTPPSDDVRIFSEDDERFFVSISNSRSDEWIMIHSGSKTSSEQWMLRTDDPTGDPRVARLREDDVEYQLDHWGDRFVVLTNLDSIDFRVMTAPLDRPDEWTELVPDRPGHRVTSIEPFAGHLVVHEWVDAQPRVRVLYRDGHHELLDLSECEGTPDSPEPHDLELGTNADWDTSELRVMYQSLTTPMTIIDVDVVSGEQVVVKRMPTPNVDLDQYVATREWVDTDDGARVPIDIIRHVETPVDGTARCVLYGYGAYEISLPPWFSIARLSFLDRGGVWALVHPRGGGELGRQWYLDGKLLDKKRTFTDTLAAADHLVEQGWSAPDRLAVRGGSAGGLLVGACITMRPDRFAAAVAEVPFVDIVSTMSDPTLPLTVTEWEEWGDPRAEPYASYMQSYSPYDNTRPADYPALYVTAGLNDPMVSYHEPAKWVAKLRTVRTNDAPLLLRTELGAGHAGPSGRYDSWRDEARVLTFLLVTT